MKYEHAYEAIKAILAAIPDSELPKPSKTEEGSGGEPCVWFGGKGYYLGSAKTRKGAEWARNPLSHRDSGALEAIEREAVCHLDLDYNPEASK